MRGRVVVMTGATSGIGKIAAERLAGMGARIVLIARDRQRGEQMLAGLRAIAPDLRHVAHYAELSRIAECRAVAAAILSEEPRIDVLINNAGAMFTQRHVTARGLELTFATNHMGYFVLTEALRERLIASAPARIVNTASDAHRGARLDFDDLQAVKSYDGFKAYGRSKLCNILFTRELARRLAGTGVTANCLHPGFVATRFGDNNPGLFRFGIRLAKLFALSPQKGAETIVYLASSPDIADVTGGYFAKCRPSTPTAAAQDDKAARRLWAESERIAAQAR